MTTVIADTIAYDPALQVWSTDDPRLSETLLAHPSLRPPPYAELYRSLQDRFGVDFTSLVFAFSHIPLCLHAGEHAAARRAMAAHVAGRRPVILPHVLDMVSRHLAPLRRPGVIDLGSAVIEPLVLDLMRLVVDIPEIGFEDCPTTSRIFSRGVGLPRRRKMEADVAVLLGQIEAARPDADAEEIGRLLSLLVLGRDALVGTLGTSLYALLADADGRRLADIPFPPSPVDTGVPYIERQVTEPVEIAGRAWAPGDRFRIKLTVFAQSGDHRERQKFFGVGAHTCLGRPLSLDLWQALGEELARIPTRVEVLDYALRDDDVFAIPARFEIRISA